MQLTWKRTNQILFIIIFLGTLLRFYDLGNNSFVADEFLDMNSAYGYAQTGQWRAWDFNFGEPSKVNINVPRDERAVIYKWQVAQLFHFLPPTETVARLVSVLWGIASIGILFWATFVLTKRREIGLIAAFLFAVSVNGIIFDRTLRMYTMFFPLYLALTAFSFLALEKEFVGKMRFCRYIWEKFGIHIHFALVAGILFILSLLTHQLTGTFVFVVAAYLFVQAIQTYRAKQTLKNKYFVLLLTIVGGVIAVAVLFPKFFLPFASGLGFFDNHYGYIKYVLRDYYHPILAVFFIMFGSWWIAKREQLSRESLWLTLSFFVPLSMAIWMWQRNVGAQYIFFAEAFSFILVSAGAFGLFTLVREKWNLSGTRLLLVLGIILVLIPNFGYFGEENNTYHETSSGSNPNYRKVFGYFKKNHQATDVLVTRNNRNYYFSGAKVPVYDLGDEISQTRLSQEELEKLMQEYKTGWVILSDNDYDYVTKGAEEFISKNLIHVSNDQVRGTIDVYRW